MTDVLRVAPVLRELHLDLGDPDGITRTTLYLRSSYETTGTPGEGFVCVTPVEMLRWVRASEARVLEIWEPLWLRFIGLHALVAIAWSASSLARHDPRPIVTHAMENADFAALLGAGRRVPRALERLAGFVLGSYVRRTTARIAFATPSSRDLYHRLHGVVRVPWRVVLDLPSPAPTPRSGRGAVFVGTIAPHKGVLDLLNAWPLVEAALPDAHLALMGNGPLAADVVAWCEERPMSRTYLGLIPRSEALEIVAGSSVLVLPSRRRRRWREQVGLPIREGLQRGLTIVTTDDTGLAPWLRENGHGVVPAGDVGALSAALNEAILHPLERSEVLNGLPAEDSWRAVSQYLYSTGPVPQCGA